MKARSLASRGFLPSYHVLTWPFFSMCTQRGAGLGKPSDSLSIRSPTLQDQGPILMTYFDLNSFLMPKIAALGLALQCINAERCIYQSTA